MAEDTEQQIRALQQRLDDLEGLFYKNNFSNLQVWDKKVQFRSGAIINTLTSTPTYTAQEGETVLVNGGGEKLICSYMSSSWQCKTYTSEIPSGTYLSNIVEDTTPQLGGQLDWNGKSMSAESGKIQTYTIAKDLVNNVDTDLFEITLGSGGALCAIVDYMVSILPNDNVNSCNYGRYVMAFSCDGSTQLSYAGNKWHEYEIENGGEGIAVTFAEDAADYEKVTVSVGANTVGNRNSKIRAIVTIIGVPTTSYTYTAL